MKFLDILRKLGIVRCGAQAAVYSGAQDRPAEVLQDDLSHGDPNPVPPPDQDSPE